MDNNEFLIYHLALSTSGLDVDECSRDLQLRQWIPRKLCRTLWKSLLHKTHWNVNVCTNTRENSPSQLIYSTGSSGVSLVV